MLNGRFVTFAKLLHSYNTVITQLLLIEGKITEAGDKKVTKLLFGLSQLKK